MTTRVGKRKVARAPEILSRSGFVSDWELSVHAWSAKEHTSGHWKRTDGLHLTVRGAFTEEVAGVTKFDFLIYPEANLDTGRSTISSVGSFLRCKPILEAGVSLSELHFQAMVSAAVAGKLSTLQVTFEKLRYGRGSISSMLLSTSKEIT
ncbi:hypothetical protein ABIC89_002807 [Variovorax boronicumulans]|uniref:hypothetical protein n=1 Tax=Variovorax boronicumulans TaxID=436515 RepID=UPI0033976F52